MHVLEIRSIDELEQMASAAHNPVIARAHAGFQALFSRHELGDAMSLTEARQNNRMRAQRTDRMIARATQDDQVFLCIHLAGIGQVHQYERVADVSPGSGVLYDARRSLEFVFPADVQSIVLQFSRDLLPVRSTEITDSCARRMDPHSPAMVLLAGYITQLYKLGDDLSAEQLRDAGHAAIDLLAMALRDMNSAVPDVTGAGDVLLEMMRLHVRDHLADDRLSVEELARRHHVSVRRVYRLFARIDTTPGAFIREQRLLAARAMLSSPRYDARSVSSIAAAVGFVELRTFEQAFRRQYGMTPARWRRERDHPGLVG